MHMHCHWHDWNCIDLQHNVTLATIISVRRRSVGIILQIAWIDTHDTCTQLPGHVPVFVYKCTYGTLTCTGFVYEVSDWEIRKCLHVKTLLTGYVHLIRFISWFSTSIRIMRSICMVILLIWFPGINYSIFSHSWIFTSSPSYNLTYMHHVTRVNERTVAQINFFCFAYDGTQILLWAKFVRKAFQRRGPIIKGSLL